MDDKECRKFAEANAGKRVLVPYSFCPYIGSALVDENEIGRIVGYKGNNLAIEFEKEQLYNIQWNVKEKISSLGIILLVPEAVKAWWVKCSSVSLFIERPIPKINPYPHSCPICKNPARKIEQIILCSNIRCKSKVKAAKITKMWKKSPARNPGDTYENPIVLICPICKNQKEVLSVGTYTIDGITKNGILCLNDLWVEYNFIPGKYYALYETNPGLFTGIKNEEWRYKNVNYND